MMTDIGSTSSAAEIRAAALAVISRERPISAASTYAGRLTDDFIRSTGRDTVTIRDAKDGPTIGGEPIAAYAARVGQVGSLSEGGAAVRKQVVDVVSYSSRAKETLSREQIALAVLGGTTKQSDAATEKTAAIAAAAGKTAAAGDAGTNSSLAADGDPSWSAKFAADYAVQSADGRDGRFYKGTDLEALAPIMGDEEYASFKAAFESRTLTIQPATGITGEYDVSFMSSGFGKGMAMGGDMQIDSAQVTSRYALVSHDTFFGATLISWGGPKVTGGV